MFKKLGGTGSDETTTETAPDLGNPGADRPTIPAQSVASTMRPDFPREERSRLIVGPNIKLKGVEITDCDTLVVEGRVEASMDSRVIQIAEGGVFNGTVAVDRAEIRGRFEGEMTVRDRLVVHTTGRVSGKIHYGRMAVEEGGEITGTIEALPRREGQAEPARTPADTEAHGGAGRPRREPFVHPTKDGTRVQAG